MTRMDFLKQLEYLLQDIDERDREDALEYYRDYMDEAGISEFASVDGLLDSPEKIAISIRASLSGDSEEQSEFSEQGVKDARWEPQKHMPDVYKKDGWSEAESRSEGKYRNSEGGWQETPGGYQESHGEERRYNDHRRSEWDDSDRESSDRVSRRGNNLGKILLIVVLCIVGLPLIAGVGSGALGILAGIFCAFIAVIVGVGGCAIGFSVGGVVLFVMSIVHMITSVPEGIMMMGFAFIMLAIGIICVILTVLICSRLIPWIVRGIVKLFQKIFRRGGAAS